MAEGTLLLRDEYASIRRVIDVTLDDQALPLEVIEDPMYLPMAEAEVLERVPDAASKTDEDQARVKAAVVWLTAARILPALPRIASEKFLDIHSASFELLDIDRLQMEWRQAANEALRMVTGTPKASSVGTVFAMAGSGWSNR